MQQFRQTHANVGVLMRSTLRSRLSVTAVEAARSSTARVHAQLLLRLVLFVLLPSVLRGSLCLFDEHDGVDLHELDKRIDGKVSTPFRSRHVNLKSRLKLRLSVAMLKSDSVHLRRFHIASQVFHLENVWFAVLCP
ncbi:hypothetical protein KCU89_g24, partial [Aureobasidium melanogenum]